MERQEVLRAELERRVASLKFTQHVYHNPNYLLVREVRAAVLISPEMFPFEVICGVEEYLGNLPETMTAVWSRGG